MAKTTLIVIIAVIVLLIVGGVLFYTMQNPSSKTTPNTGTTTNNNPAGSDQNAPSPGNTGTQVEQTNTIKISSFAFSPSSTTIKAGMTVTWTNQDSVKHTVTSDSGSELSSPEISNGQSYSHTFNTKGAFSYHCAIHPSMKGIIVIE